MPLGDTRIAEYDALIDVHRRNSGVEHVLHVQPTPSFVAIWNRRRREIAVHILSGIDDRSL
jgi:hypothetical protein